MYKAVVATVDSTTALGDNDYSSYNRIIFYTKKVSIDDVLLLRNAQNIAWRKSFPYEML